MKPSVAFHLKYVWFSRRAILGLSNKSTVVLEKITKENSLNRTGTADCTIMPLHFGVVERSRCLNAKMQSPLLLRSFEHSGPMTLCESPHVLVVLRCTACAW